MTTSDDSREDLLEWFYQDRKACFSEEFGPTNPVSELLLSDTMMDSETASKHLQEGLEDWESGNVSEETADSFLKGYRVSGDPSLAFDYAITKIELEDYQEAYKALGWVLDKHPNFPQAEYNLAVVAYLNGQVFKAMERLWSDLKQNWANARKWKILGYLCSLQNWWNKAAYFSLKSLSLSYGDAGAYRRAYVALIKMDNSEAAGRFEQYLDGKTCSSKRQVAQLIDGIQLKQNHLNCSEIYEGRKRVVELSGFDEKDFLPRVRQAQLDEKLPREMQEKLGVESPRVSNKQEEKKTQQPGGLPPTVRLARQDQQQRIERWAAQASAYQGKLSKLKNQARKRFNFSILTQLRKAYQTVYARSPSEAVSGFKSWVEKYHYKAAAFVELAKMCRDLGIYEDAIHYYERAIMLSPRHRETEVYKSLSDIYTHGITTRQIGLADAVHRFEYYVDRRRCSSYARLYLAKFYRQQGRPQEAIKQLKTAIKYQPKIQELHSELALAYLDCGDLEAALQVFVKRGRRKARLSEVYHRLYTLLSMMGDREALVDRFREFVELHPNDEYAHFYYGRALQKIGRLQEAADEFKKSVHINPGFLEGYNYLSSILQNMERFDDAISEFEKFVSKHSRIAHLHYMLGTLYERKAEESITWQETEKWHAKARRKFRDSIETRLSYRASYALGKGYERFYRIDRDEMMKTVRKDVEDIIKVLQTSKGTKEPLNLAAIVTSHLLAGALDAAYIAGLDAISSTLHETKQKALNAYDCLQAAKQEVGAISTLQELDSQIDRLAQRLAAVHRYVSLGIKVNFSLQDINQMVEDVLYEHQARCDVLGIEISQNLEWEEVPEFEADRASLLEALNNLITNAIEALEKWDGPRQITVKTSYDGEMVMVEVKDTGPGVPQDRDIFDLGVTTKEKGTGYGLAQVKKAVESIHQGRVTFESSSNQGTIFVIRLPYYKPGEVKTRG